MKAHELLSERSKWVKRDYAVNAHGAAVLTHAPTAVCWCALGALSLCYGHGSLEYYDACKKLVQAIGTNFSKTPSSDSTIIVVWNDAYERTFEEIHAALVAADV